MDRGAYFAGASGCRHRLPTSQRAPSAIQDRRRSRVSATRPVSHPKAAAGPMPKQSSMSHGRYARIAATAATEPMAQAESLRRTPPPATMGFAAPASNPIASAERNEFAAPANRPKIAVGDRRPTPQRTPSPPPVQGFDSAPRRLAQGHRLAQGIGRTDLGNTPRPPPNDATLGRPRRRRRTPKRRKRRPHTRRFASLHRTRERDAAFPSPTMPRRYAG